nr:putative ribonuclease H-like domain-containing protein [Tanacetum cinerariifolium]
MDVKTSFLNRIRKEEVYIGQPPGFVSKQYPDHVYALYKALYGLKQAPRAWCDILSQFLIESGFQKVPTPMVEQTKLKLDLVGKPVDHTNYRIMIRSLIIEVSGKSQIELFFVYKDLIFESQDMSTSTTHQQSLADAGSETRPLMLERGSYIPWASHFRRNTQRLFVREEIIEGNNVKNDAGNIQKILRTTSLGSAANVQCYNCSEKGHYARNYPKPKVQDSKYFMEQMLLAKHDKVRVTLTDEQNDFLVANATQIKPSTTFVNPLFAKDNQKQKYPKQPKIINNTIGDDQIDSNIILDELNVDVNSSSVEYDNNVQALYEEDANIKLLRSLPSAWNNIALIMRNKSDLDTLSIDDLYNNLKVINETVNIAQSVSAASFKDQASTTSYYNDVMFSFFSNQSNSLQLDNEDLEQIYNDDLKEMWKDTAFWFLCFVSCDLVLRFGPAFCLKTSCVMPKDKLRFALKLVAFCFKARCVLLQDTLRFASRHLVFCFKTLTRESDGDDNPVNDRFKKCEGYHAVPPPYTRNYMPPRVDLSFVGLDNSVFKSKEWESDSEDKNVFKPKEVKKTVKPSLEMIEFVNARNNTIENKNKAKKPRKFSQSPRAVVLTKSRQVPVNAAKQSSYRAASSVSAARRVNTAASRPNVNNALPTTYSYFKAHSPVIRPFNKKSVAKTNNFNEKVNIAKVIDVTTAGIKADQGIFDSGCSRHMTGNKSYLTDYQENDGGFVAFRGNAKGEKSVLFTDTECVVLSPDFKLLYESQVLFKVPRNNNMYSFDLKNVVPVGGLSCLFPKATLDESNLWHRRLGHINFKTKNKLVRENLVRGFPLMLFENDHTCVAFQKGNQHKASYKTKTVSSISKPLQLLHMDLFGPVSTKIINKKTYCLVVTDDFSRFSWVFFLATKDETPEILKNFIAGVENQMDHKVKTIRCDNETKFKNRLMNEFYEMKGIRREFSVARTP